MAEEHDSCTQLECEDAMKVVNWRCHMDPLPYHLRSLHHHSLGEVLGYLVEDSVLHLQNVTCQKAHTIVFKWCM